MRSFEVIAIFVILPIVQVFAQAPSASKFKPLANPICVYEREHTVLGATEGGELAEINVSDYFIIRESDKPGMVKVWLKFSFDNAVCSLDGLAQKKGADYIYTEEMELSGGRVQTCELTIKRQGDRMVLNDKGGICSQGVCGKGSIDRRSCALTSTSPSTR
jgi:hypothetical protein